MVLLVHLVSLVQLGSLVLLDSLVLPALRETWELLDQKEAQDCRDQEVKSFILELFLNKLILLSISNIFR